MELGGVVGMEGLVSGASSEFGGVFSSPLVSSDSELKQRGVSCSSGRSGGFEENEWRFPKMARTGAMLAPSITMGAASLHRSNSHSLFPEGEQMLSFSSSPSSKPDAMVHTSDGTLPYYHHPSSSSSAPSYLGINAGVSGLGSGGSNVNMNGVLSRVRGPFTPSQWMELEHQALIYKYIDAKMPIPHSLLISIRRSLNPSGFSSISAGSFGSSSLGWGSFHLGYSGNVDPEPGRCRRTDGKKWRCSRDAVADQKYCERHMNRGRHRSRKHVEGQTGYATKAIPIIQPSQSASAVSGGVSSSSLTITQQQMKSLRSNATDPCPAQLNRMLISKENVNNHVQDSKRLSTLNSMSSKPMDTLFTLSKQNPFEVASSEEDFGHITTEIILNPSRSSTQKFSFIPTPKLSDQRPKGHPLRHFVDDWPKNQSVSSTIMWPHAEEMQSDRTQLSISIPMSSSGFSSSSSSPNQEKLTLSPLKLSWDFDPIHMGLGVGGVLNEVTQRQASRTPISWKASMAGPLGEALTNASNTPKDQGKNCSSSLNLLTDGWDSSPGLEASPTGVLQKTNFGSLSSSTGSSPRTESHKVHNSTGSLSDDLLGSNLVDPPNIPSL